MTQENDMGGPGIASLQPLIFQVSNKLRHKNDNLSGAGIANKLYGLVWNATTQTSKHGKLFIALPCSLMRVEGLVGQEVQGGESQISN